MNAEISFLDHQREAAAAARVATRRGEGPPWNAKASRLLAAGWAHKVRLGRRIWCRDAADAWQGWKSEEAAFEVLTRGERNAVE